MDFQRYPQKPSFGQQPVFNEYKVTGMVKRELNTDGKPVCNYDAMIATRDKDPKQQTISDCSNWHSWFNDVDPGPEGDCFSAEATNQLVNNAVGGPQTCQTGNMRIDDHVIFSRVSSNQHGGSSYDFTSYSFFPLNGKGFNDKIARSAWATNSVLPDGRPNPEFFDNNYLFTTEMKFDFQYKGGETFTFSGDDDVWIFVNKQLAVDLGGVHYGLNEVLNLDNIAASHNLELNKVYTLNLFHAERQTQASQFRVQTNENWCIIDDCPAKCKEHEVVPGQRFWRGAQFFDETAPFIPSQEVCDAANKLNEQEHAKPCGQGGFCSANPIGK